MKRTVIRGGRVIDPGNENELDQVMDVAIQDGCITELGEDLAVGNETVILDAAGLIVAPGLIDMHVHLREPGNEDEETISSGAAAAVQGGFTTVVAMPNTEPPVDNEASAAFVLLQAQKAGQANVFPAGAITMGLEGKRLSEMGQLARAGAVGFSDANHTVVDSAVLRSAFEYAKMLDRPIMTHPEDAFLCRDGVMNEGGVSVELGLPAIPEAAEEICVWRDVRLAEMTSSRLHVQQISTAGAVEIIRRAKARGANVTAEVCTHHLFLTEQEVRSFDANVKVSPPLRTQADCDALLDGLLDGAIDAITDGHAPHAPAKKALEFLYAPPGIIGLETTLGLCLTKLVHTGRMTLNQLIRLMSTNPARILGLAPRGSLQIGAPADITIIDPDREWTVDVKRFVSKSRNCPYHGWALKGRAAYTIVGGRVFAVGTEEGRNQQE